MELFIDPRAGSKPLIDKFPGECTEQLLEAGDIAFFGNGPDNAVWYIGIEYKKLDDFCASMKSGRFTGTQLPAMMRLYDISFVLIEGIGFLDRHTGMLVKKMGKMSHNMGLYFKGFQNFMTSVSVHSSLAGRPCFIQRTVGPEETLQTIRATYDYFQKPWEHHTGISRPDRSKMEHISYELEVVKVQPDDPDYPKYLLRKALFQIDRIGWEVAGKIAEYYGTMEALMTAPQREIEEVPVGPNRSAGKITARRIFESLHGYSDQNYAKRKKKPKTEELVDIGIGL